MAKGAIFLTPLYLLISSYIILDPFKVIYNYDDFSKDWAAILNREVVCTQTFINNNPKYHYQSFILGNSRTLAFLSDDWKPYINDSVAFHFDASEESIFGLWTKAKYLDRNCDAIKNVLIVCDPQLFIKTDEDEKWQIYIKDYRVAGTSAISFHLTFFRGFISGLFFIRYYDYLLFGKYRSYMDGFLDTRRIQFLPVTNDLLLVDLEENIKTDSSGYFNRQSWIVPRTEAKMYHMQVLGETQRNMLADIKSIFERHNTKFKVIISPTYDQVNMDTSDVKILKQIMGEKNVFDFSGINEYTAYHHNYYEDSHYRPTVGKAILKKIYER